jgi:hypothetical protein
MITHNATHNEVTDDIYRNAYMPALWYNLSDVAYFTSYSIHPET